MDEAGGYRDYDFIAEMYDHVTAYNERRDVDFFIEESTRSGGPVLEIGCGTGRVLIPTARAGVEITGLDLSEHMLERCRSKLKAEDEDVRSRAKLVHGDMRDFDVGTGFRLATIPFRPFQHLTTVEDQMACLGSIHRALGAGGRLILDLFNPSLQALTADNLGVEVDEDLEFSLPDGSRVRRSFCIRERDHFNQLSRSELIYDVTRPDGHEHRFVHAFPMRHLYRFEAEHLLARCGFEVEALFADYDRSPYGSKYPGELIFAARKV
jgi:SAM-dependent methyltransferase